MDAPDVAAPLVAAPARPARRAAGAAAGLERVRALAADGETELAAIEAIRALAAGASAGSAALRAALWNDLGVLRFSRGDAHTAAACLREACRLDPDSGLAAANLADVEPHLAAPPRSVDAALVRGAETASPWVREALAVAGRRPGLRGRRVLEIGGAVPRELVAGTGAADWVACDPGAREPQQAPGYRVRRADVRALPFPEQSFDVAFSSCAFEHIHELERALAEIARVLVPGGMLFTQFAPIWSCSLGHHLFLDDTSRGRLTFNDRVLPDWSHLLLGPAELEPFLAVALGPRDARRAVDFVFGSPYLNRLFEADFSRLFAAAPLELVQRSAWGTRDRLTPGLARELAHRHPAGGRFDVPGIRALLVKP